VSACLAKALKIAETSSKAASLTAGAGAGAGETAGLWTSALDAHLWFFENGCEGVHASAVAELLKRTDEELSALSSRGACPPDVRAHYDATVRHVAHQRERIDAVGERYRELPET
jgi:vacuolar protein sorting-associated protein 35